MKLLVDTCAWLLLLRRKNKTAMNDDEQLMLTSLTEAIQDGRVAIIGPVRQEVLSGIKEAAQFDKLRSALEPFQDEPLLRRSRAPVQPVPESRCRVWINGHFGLCSCRPKALGHIDL